ncbi:hypothetical protein Trydic_g21120 [Trypoxylus dichotomus]
MRIPYCLTLWVQGGSDLMQRSWKSIICTSAIVFGSRVVRSDGIQLMITKAFLGALVKCYAEFEFCRNNGDERYVRAPEEKSQVADRAGTVLIKCTVTQIESGKKMGESSAAPEYEQLRTH